MEKLATNYGRCHFHDSPTQSQLNLQTIKQSVKNGFKSYYRIVDLLDDIGIIYPEYPEIFLDGVCFDESYWKAESEYSNLINRLGVELNLFSLLSSN